MILTKANIASVDLDELIYGMIQEEQHAKFLLVVPTNRKQRQLKKELINQSPQNTADKINVESLSSFFQKLLANQKNFSMMSEGARSVLIRQCSEKVKLSYFTAYKNIPHGTLERITNVISEYKKRGITPEQLKREVERGDINERDKASDIANIYELFRNKCHELNAFEIGDVYREILQLEKETLMNSLKKSYPLLDTIIFSGFSEFTRPEVSIISRLSQRDDLQMFIDLDYYKYNPAVFSHIEESYSRLEEQGFKKVEDRSTQVHSSYFAHVKENLFIKNKVFAAEGYERKIHTLESPSRESEITTIAREIKRLILQEDVKPNEICLAFNLVKNYSFLVRDKFNIFGIPLNLTDRIGLNNSAPVIAVVNLLEVLETRYFYKSLFRALSSHLISIDNLDLSNLMIVAGELKIISGIDKWKKYISSAIHSETFEEEKTGQNKERFSKALRDIAKVEKILKPFERDLSIDDFLKEMNNLLVEIKLPQNILSIGGEKSEENVKGLTALIETITEVFRLIEIDEGRDKKYDISYFLEQIRTACRWSRFNVKEKSSYGVLVTSLDEIRGLKFKHLFIAGLCDGELPTRYNPEIFFSGSFRRGEEYRLCEERFRFYQAISSWSDKLYLSYPGSDSKRELNESTFLKDFKTIFKTSELVPGELKKFVFSKEEFLQSVSIGEFNEPSEYEELVKSAIKRDPDEFKTSLEIDRLSSESANEFSGMLISEENNLAGDYKLSKQGGADLAKNKDRVFSVSQLEKYAACPFKYFLENILSVTPLEEPKEDIEALEFGNILHSVLFNFSLWLREKNIDMRNCSDTQFDEALKMIIALSEKELEKIKIDDAVSFYEMEKLFGLVGDIRESILYKYLELERNDDSGFKPEYFETTFGRTRGASSDPLLSREEPVLIGDVKLQGKIDRVEISDDKKSFNVVDYKSGGKSVSQNEINEGLFLQLPVYLYAMKQMLGEQESKTYMPAFMYIYSLKFRKDDFGKSLIKLSSKKNYDLIEQNESLFKIIEEKIPKYVEDISRGKFNLSSHPDREKRICSFCNFKSVCRVAEES